MGINPSVIFSLQFDCFHRGENQGPSFKRLYIDIEHLNLGRNLAF